MTTATSTQDRLETSARRVLETLQRWDDRFSKHANQKRVHDRKAFQRKLTIIVPESRSPTGDVYAREICEVWTRNISQSGLAFLTHGELVTTSTHIVINLGTKCMLCKIMRHREVHDGFWEYGIKYVEEVQM